MHDIYSITYPSRLATFIYCRHFCKRYVLLLTTLSSLCFFMAWCSSIFAFLLFVAIVPILMNIQYMHTHGKSKLHIWFVTYCSFLGWNLLTIWWIYHAIPLGLGIAFYNAFMLSLPVYFYYSMRQSKGTYVGYIGLVVSWLTLEHFHYTWEWWELSFPWLNLGNGLANVPSWIQWYEYTGVLGGSLWILIINTMIYHFLCETNDLFLLKILPCCFLLPLCISWTIYYTYQEQGEKIEAITVQPNFDNYTQKNEYGTEFIPVSEQIDCLLQLSQEQLTPNTRLLVWPESAIDVYLNEQCINKYKIIEPICSFLSRNSKLYLTTGGSSVCNKKQVKPTALSGKRSYMDLFNSAFLFNKEGIIDIYHKTKRLPFGEYIPYITTLPDLISDWLLKILGEIAGISPSYAKGDGAKMFTTNDNIPFVPIICYESIYGAMFCNVCQKGAMLFIIITNDGWWQDTPVYNQHFQYSRLLAIAHRKSIVRSANTGISGFINQRGDVVGMAKQLQVAVVRQEVCLNPKKTFYSLYGDCIGYVALLFFSILICIRVMTNLKIILQKR